MGIVSCELLSLWLDFRALCLSLGILVFCDDFHVGVLSCVMIFLWPHSSVGRLCGGMMCLWDVLSVGWFFFGLNEGRNCRVFVRYFGCTSFVMLLPNQELLSAVRSHDAFLKLQAYAVVGCRYKNNAWHTFSINLMVISWHCTSLMSFIRSMR